MIKPVTIKNTSDLLAPNFIRPKLIRYEREGIEFSWEMVKTHNSVHVLVNNIDNKELLFVEQVRIPVKVNNPETEGITTECCAGIIDGYKGNSFKLTAQLIARDEIKEELGYSLEYFNVSPIRTLNSSVGTSGSTSYMMYAEVTNDQYIGQQLNFGEDIKVKAIAYKDIHKYIDTLNTDAITLSLIYWWLLHKLKENK